MNQSARSSSRSLASTWLALGLLLALLVGASGLASLVQTDFGRVVVTDVTYPNFNGLQIRAKLLRPIHASADWPRPGAVYIHGYQNNRETSDPYAIELARRGFVVLEIDALGRGNSDLPGDQAGPDFDRTYGAKTSWAYLRTRPFVRPEGVGLMGHSLGAEMAYNVALGNPEVPALAISGFAYTDQADTARPRNMLMMIGRWDEYRRRMTGVDDIERDWLASPRGRKVFPVPTPRLGVTYGDFKTGTARRVVVPPAIHLQVSHSRAAVAEALLWMKAALDPPAEEWLDPADQIWPIKEWATLVAMLAGLALLLPAGRLLLATPFFSSLARKPADQPVCSPREFRWHVFWNALLTCLYLPLILGLFAFHIYLVRIDRVFPMMLLNALVWWLVWINVLGFFLFRRWFRKEAHPAGATLEDLGVSWAPDRFHLDGPELARTAGLAVILFGLAYGLEHLMEAVFIVDYRFIFPFASDLTLARAKLFLLYFPFILVGFLQTGVYLHGQVRLPARATVGRTFVRRSGAGILALTSPLLFMLAVQYVPLLAVGFIPLVGPGGMLANFTMTLFHVVGIMVMVVPISTWFFEQTGKVYLGAILVALLVTWMLVSSQVAAPIPV